MKRLTILLFILVGVTSLSFAMDGMHQKLTPEEFKAKKQAYITEKAGLSKEEAAKFFPLYFQLYDKKKQLNDRIWQTMQKGKDDKLTQAQYEEILLNVYDLRLQSDNLDKEYYYKFKEILTPQKIFKVQRAETRFHRELVRDVNHGHKGGGNQRKGKK